MKKLAYFIFVPFLGSLFLLNSCEEDKTFVAPSVISPSETSVVIEESVEIAFSYTTAGGFKSSSVYATNGTAAVSSDGTANSTSGTITITFTAGVNTGAGSVTLTVTDNGNQSYQATAVLTIAKEIAVSANITANTTWKKGKIYVLKNRVSVLPDVTLTIEPGVIIKGEAGTGANATALLIARGAKIMAEGTAGSPIIFTSVADEIQPGQVSSPNLDPTLNGLWGGLIVLGNAPISVKTGETAQIEGIPASDQNGLYGGTNAADNSGVIRYVSVRHGGANIGEGNEINGLTLGGVGSGTTIENIEIVANQDDGIEWFGGTVSVKNALVWNTEDDAIDADQSWIGMLDNFIVINPGDKCFELDGPEGAAAVKNYMIKNGSVQAKDAVGLVDNDAKNNSTDSNADMENVYFFDIKPGQTFDEIPKFYTCVFKNFQVTLPEGTTIPDFFKDGSDAFTTAVTLKSNAVGADKTKFATWSWAAASGVLVPFK
ncbi:MAG: hypothetical protein RBS73_03600 [Prolixibacteraceae bacterium]|nr:hypothetical protein [Prolixibacteraceae bacterium]